MGHFFFRRSESTIVFIENRKALHDANRSWCRLCSLHMENQFFIIASFRFADASVHMIILRFASIMNSRQQSAFLSSYVWFIIEDSDMFVEIRLRFLPFSSSPQAFAAEEQGYIRRSTTFGALTDLVAALLPGLPLNSLIKKWFKKLRCSKNQWKKINIKKRLDKDKQTFVITSTSVSKAFRVI